MIIGNSEEPKTLPAFPGLRDSGPQRQTNLMDCFNEIAARAGHSHRILPLINHRGLELNDPVEIENKWTETKVSLIKKVRQKHQKKRERGKR